MFICYSMDVEVRRQLVAVSSLLLLCGTQGALSWKTMTEFGVSDLVASSLTPELS